MLRFGVLLALLMAVLPVQAQETNEPLTQAQTFYTLTLQPDQMNMALATYASETLVSKLLTVGASFESLFCSNQLPTQIAVASAIGSGDFIYERDFQNDGMLVQVTTDLSQFFVEMKRINDIWKVDDVICGTSPAGRTLEMLAAHINGWHGDGDLITEARYRDSGYFTPTFIEYMDKNQPDAHFDMLLCAQNIPDYFVVMETLQNQAGDRALVTVRSNFPGHELYFYLQNSDGAWLIDQIECSPIIQNALAWATEYIRYYQANTAGEYDLPYFFLFSRDVPSFVEATLVSGGYEAAQATVALTFEVAPMGAQPVVDPTPTCDVSMLYREYRWLIIGIVCEES